MLQRHALPHRVLLGTVAPGDDLDRLAAAGAVMPQKSTYFFPKLWSGFLLNPLED